MINEKSDCMQGTRNEMRIGVLEKNMDKLQTMIFWLTTSSFMLLAGLITTLITRILKGG